jgi:hypothetical protein
MITQGADVEMHALFRQGWSISAIYYLEAIAQRPGRLLRRVRRGARPVARAGERASRPRRRGAPEDLRAILDGLDPRTGETLVGYRKNSGFDLTLSAPKSVSLLWGLGDRATAEQVVAAHDQAVLAALAYLEDAAPGRARRRRRGNGGDA